MIVALPPTVRMTDVIANQLLSSENIKTAKTKTMALKQVSTVVVINKPSRQ